MKNPTSATDLANLVRCPHRVFLDAHGPAAEKLQVSTTQQLLWDEGSEHEARVMENVYALSVPTDKTPAFRADMTRTLMTAGAHLIYQGFFATDDLTGVPDLLQRIETPSLLGAFSYVPVEIKNGGAFTDSKGTKPKLPYVLQLCAYAELLENVQGVRPQRGIVIDHKDQWNEIDLAPFAEVYTDARRRFAEVQQGHEPSVPGWKPICSQCAWKDHCWKELVTKDDLTTMAAIGEAKRDALVQIGIRTVSDLAASTPEQLLEARGVGAAAARIWPLRARAVKSGNPVLVRPWEPPAVDFEVSYDVENTPEPFVYLHGLSVRPAPSRNKGLQQAVFDPVCAEFPESEADVWKRFLAAVEAIDAKGSYVVYIYSPHEKGVLRRLQNAHGGSEALTRFEGNIVDLCREVKRSIIFPTDADGLKTIATFVGFKWRDEDPGGAQSMSWWREYWNDPASRGEARERVLRYNEDDVAATFAIRDWLGEFAKPTKDSERVQGRYGYHPE